MADCEVRSINEFKDPKDQDFNDLAKQYEPMIRKIIHSLNIYKNRDEFFQLGLVGLWEAINRFDAEKGNFTNYAYTYIKGLFMSEMTKATKQEERNVYPKDEFWEVIEDSNSEQPLEMIVLLSYCEALTEKQAKWLLYTCIDGLSVKEIAQREHVSVSTVKAWRKGAQERLKKILEVIA